VARVRKRTELEEEKMTDSNLSRVIRLLEPEEGKKPITKKDACQMLGMTYNTTRLATIIEQFKERQRRTAEQRAKLRGKAVTKDEKIFIIQEYLSGGTIDSITKSTYRGVTIVKQVLEEYSVPLRVPGQTYFNPQLIPDGATRDKFEVGEVVWSARYLSLAKIYSEKLSEKHGWIYHMWLMDEKQKQYCWQPAYELASLQQIRELGVQV
jgi:hypothetical protein